MSAPAALQRSGQVREVDRLDPPRWHHASIQLEHLARQLEAEAEECTGLLVDLGCGARPYAPFRNVRFVGVDLVASHGEPDVLAAAEHVPIESGTADVVLTTQQLEHVSEPAAVLTEARRILRGSGRLLSTHGVWVHHPDPLDPWRWTEEGLCRLIEQAGFHVERVHRQGELVAAASVLLTYPLSAKAAQGGLARVLRPLPTMMNWFARRADAWAARFSPRHLASPSHLVVAAPRGGC